MLPKQVTEVTVSALVFIVLMHSKNKKGLSENSPFLLASAKCTTYVVSFDTTMLVFVPHMWYFFKYHEMYHICGIFLIPQEGKKPPLDVLFPENMVSPDGGERPAAVLCFSLYVNQSSGCSFSQIHTYLFWGWRLFRCVLQLHAGHDLRYGDFSGPPQRWPYFLHFKGSIFTTT